MESKELELQVKTKGVKKFCRKIDKMTNSIKNLNRELEKANQLTNKLTDFNHNQNPSFLEIHS